MAVYLTVFNGESCNFNNKKHLKSHKRLDKKQFEHFWVKFADFYDNLQPLKAHKQVYSIKYGIKM